MGNTALDVVLRGQRDFFPGASFGADFTRGRYKLGKRQARNPAGLPGWTFTRASTGYAETAAGALVAFASGAPRITDKGLLVEESRVNYALRSQEFDNATYIKTNMAVTSDDTLAPDGTQTADKVYVSSAAAGTTTYQNVTPGAGTTITASIYAKKGTAADKINQFGIRDATAGVTLLVFTVNYDTLAITYSTGSSGVTVQQLADGWIRVIMTLAWTSGNLARVYCGAATGTLTLNDYAYMWGLQVEVGSFPTSYIPTTTASATRLADVAYISGTNLVPLTAGTLCFESAACLWGADGVDHVALDWSSGSEGLARFSGGSFQIHDGVGYRTSNVFSTAGVAAKLAVSYGGTNISASLNGAAVSTYGSFDGSLTANTKLSIGGADGGNAQWSGYIRRAVIYPYAMTNAQLQTITTPDPVGPTVQLEFNTSRYVLNGAMTTDPTALSGWTFSRASTGYAETVAGALTSFASGSPRITDKGLLVEESRTNLLLRSQEFDNASWTKTDTTITADSVLAPDGTTTADLATEGSAGTAQIGQGVTVSSGATVAIPIYLKRGNTDWIRVTLVNGGNFVRAWFNLGTGAVGTSGVGGTGVLTSATIAASVNGFYRVVLVGSIPATTAYSVFINTASADNSSTRVSGGTYYPWGAQLEAGSFPTSYIPTTTASATRAADDAYINSAAAYNALAGTLYAEFSGAANQTSTSVAAGWNASSTNNDCIRVGQASGGVNGRSDVRSGNAAQAGWNAAVYTNGSTVKGAVSVELDSMNFACNGTAATRDTTATMPTGITRLGFGFSYQNGLYLNGYLRRTIYYPYATSDAGLQSLTA